MLLRYFMRKNEWIWCWEWMDLSRNTWMTDCGVGGFEFTMANFNEKIDANGLFFIS